MSPLHSATSCSWFHVRTMERLAAGLFDRQLAALLQLMSAGTSASVRRNSNRSSVYSSSSNKSYPAELDDAVSRESRQHKPHSAQQEKRRLKLSYVHGESSLPLIGATVGQLLEQTTAKMPDKEAVVVSYQNIRFTFQQLLEHSDKLAAGLLALGVKKGDRVGIWAPNCIEWIIVQYATARAGMIMVNINPAYQASELQYVLQKVGLKVLIMAERFKTQDYYKIMCSICSELEDSQTQRISNKLLPELQWLVTISDKKFAGAVRFSDVMDSANNELISVVHDGQQCLQFDDPINIQFTSGTTGQPKGALLTHHNIINNSMFTGVRMDYHIHETRICLPVPLYHCFGMVMGSLQMPIWGATCVFPSPSFEPESALKAAEEERCTSLYGTPTMFIDMLNLPNFDSYKPQSLYTGIMAGSPCPTEIMKKVISQMNMHKVTICYGSTENSPVTFQSLMDDPVDKRVSTVGRVHPHVEAKVVDESGSIVPVGHKGELCIRGYNVMRCYWDDPEHTRKVIGQDRWYRTGDVAILNHDGYLRIVGRIKDMIIRGGENIYPVEVEQFLYQHPKIADVQVIGVPDERLGEQVAAWIRLKDGQNCTRQEILDFCKGKIAHYKVPYYISFVESFPLTVTGKVQKYKMREMTATMYGVHDEDWMQQK